MANGSRPYREVAPPDSPKWLAARKTGIGSSEAAAACGRSHWDHATPLDVYLRKLGKVPEFAGNLHTRIGRTLEPLILQMFQEETGKTAVPGIPMMRSSRFPWSLATPDAFVGHDEIAECKWTGIVDQWGEMGSDEIPEEIVLQCQQQLGVTGRKVVWVPVLTRYDFRVYRVDRNEDLIEWILNVKERQLWERILQEDPPGPSAEKWGAAAAVNALYGFKVERVGIEFSAASNRHKRRLEGLRQAIKDLELEAETVKAEILAEMGTAEYGIAADGTALRRQYVKGSSYTVNREEAIHLKRAKAPKALLLVDPHQITHQTTNKIANGAKSSTKAASKVTQERFDVAIHKRLGHTPGFMVGAAIDGVKSRERAKGK